MAGALKQLSFLQPRPLAVSARRTSYLLFYDAVRRVLPLSESKRRYSSGPQDGQTERAVSSAQSLKSSRRPLTRVHSPERLADLDHAGIVPYPRMQSSTGAIRQTVVEFLNECKDADDETLKRRADEAVQISGRIVSIMEVGSKLVFITIQDGPSRNRIQGVFSFNGLSKGSSINISEFQDLSGLFKRGDYISIIGHASRAKNGGINLQATQMPSLLSAALRPLPQTLTDEATKVENRHIDMYITPETNHRIQMRFYVMKQLRRILEDRSFTEVQTPVLTEDASGATARPFKAMASPGVLATQTPLSLRISPELWLKRLVVAGMDRVFEIGPCFRNEGVDQTHNPEFSTCEFYQAFENIDGLMATTKSIMYDLANLCSREISEHLTSLPAIDLAYFEFSNYQQTEFIPGLEAALQFKLPDLTDPNAHSLILTALTQHNLLSAAGEAPHSISLVKLLDRLAATYLEPRSLTHPLFITHHPACMAPLSKSFVCTQTNQTVSARAELFIKGSELANMYEEENDPREQRRKFEAQAQRHRERLVSSDGSHMLGEDEDPAPYVVDKNYLSVLESGMPPTGGWGCGIERLAMLFSGSKRISDVLPFGNLRNVVGLSAMNRMAEDQKRSKPRFV